MCHLTAAVSVLVVVVFCAGAGKKKETFNLFTFALR